MTNIEEFIGESLGKSNDGSGLGYICDACFGWGDGFGSDCYYGFGISNSDNGLGYGSGKGSGYCSGGTTC